MVVTASFRRIAIGLILLSIISGVSIAYATLENGYKADNSFLTDVSESTRTENGYKANIIINPHITGIYANENGFKLDLSINPQGVGGSLKENGYKLDLIPEKTFPDIPDVAITKIVTSKTVVGQGYTTLINVTVSNQALNYETFHVIVHANTTTIKTQTITLTSGNTTTLTFIWNTSGFAKGNYTIWAYAWPVQGETDTEDNNCTNGWVTVTWLGDLDGDFDVDQFDFWHFCSAFIDYYTIHVKDPNCDFDNDCDIDQFDYWAFCGAFIDYYKAK
jgi:hypothetical protein